MKTGFSIILGEYIDASALTHRDCEPFQIVCPECREPMFKVERPQETESTQYLSHYKLKTPFADCELRVEGASRSDREAYNAFSRNQTLEHFLGVFRSLLERDPKVGYKSGYDKAHSHFKNKRAWGRLQSLHRQGLIGNKDQSTSLASQEFFTLCAENYTDEYANDMPDTGFSGQANTWPVCNRQSERGLCGHRLSTGDRAFCASRRVSCRWYWRLAVE